MGICFSEAPQRNIKITSRTNNSCNSKSDTIQVIEKDNEIFKDMPLWEGK